MDKTQQEVIQELIEKTQKELSQPPQPQQQSRSWTHPEGYRYLVQWSNAMLLRYLVALFTNSLPKSEYRKRAQLDDAARSTVRNIEEGYKRANTTPYIEFLSYSQGSLEEVKGDIRDLTQDKFLASQPSSTVASLGISLKDFNETLKGKLKDSKGGYVPLEILYPPLKKIKAQDLTYEIFIELINKTDYLLRGLVSSLEKKLTTEKKGYQVQQARIKGRLK